MSEILKQHIEQYKAVFAKHQLVEELRTADYVAFFMGQPFQGRMNSVRILFTPDGIALVGDHTPERNGTVSCMGYGEDFFRVPRGEYYLAEKFLSKKWVPELCKEVLALDLAEQDAKARDGVADWTDEQREEVRELLPLLGDMGREAVHDALNDAVAGHYDEGPPGWDYDPREVGCLVAIQHRFAELYKAEERKWRDQSERYRKLIEKSMEKYSQQLGWGLTGGQEECWTMLDRAVDRLALLEAKLPELATMIRDQYRYHQGEPVAASFNAALQRLGELEVKPFPLAAGS
jgi:hypothetical protein